MGSPALGGGGSDNSQAMDALVKNIRWGAATGFFGGLALLAIGLVRFVLSPIATPADGLPILALTGFYVLGGTAAGAIVGSMRPWATGPLGGAAVGILAAVPMFVAGRILLFGFVPWRVQDSILGVIFCVSLGGLVGAILGSAYADTDGQIAKRHPAQPSKGKSTKGTHTRKR